MSQDRRRGGEFEGHSARLTGKEGVKNRVCCGNAEPDCTNGDALPPPFSASGTVGHKTLPLPDLIFLFGAFAPLITAPYGHAWSFRIETTPFSSLHPQGLAWHMAGTWSMLNWIELIAYQFLLS